MTLKVSPRGIILTDSLTSQLIENVSIYRYAQQGVACLLCCSGFDWIVLSESRLYSFLCGLCGTSMSLVGKMVWGQVLPPCAVNVLPAGNAWLTASLQRWALLSPNQLKPAQRACAWPCATESGWGHTPVKVSCSVGLEQCSAPSSDSVSLRGLMQDLEQ